MLVLLYFMLFLVLAGAALRWQAVRYERQHRLAPRTIRRSGTER